MSDNFKPIMTLKEIMQAEEPMTQKRNMPTPTHSLDYEVSELEDKTWEVWTPDFNGACIGAGKTRDEAIRDTISNLGATIASLVNA